MKHLLEKEKKYLYVNKPPFISQTIYESLCSFTTAITSKLYKQTSSWQFYVNSCILHIRHVGQKNKLKKGKYLITNKLKDTCCLVSSNSRISGNLLDMK